MDGEVELNFVYEDINIKRFFNRGSYFGSNNIISGDPYEYNLKANIYVKAMSLPKNKFL